MKDSPVGIVDSGFGGLSIYQSVTALLPHESTVYVGDHAYIPYGGRTKQDIRRRMKKIIAFLRLKHIKMLVVACNTATIAGIDVYRKWFPDLPIIGVVPVVKTASEESAKRSFAVLSTSFTAKSAYQRDLIKKFAWSCRVYNLGCPNLLSFVEDGVLAGPAIDRELRTLLTPRIIKAIDIVVLGCTHYPFLRRSIRAIVGGKVRVLDSGGAVARHVQRILSHNGLLIARGSGIHTFYSTKRDEKLSNVASTLLGMRVRVEYAHI